MKRMSNKRRRPGDRLTDEASTQPERRARGRLRWLASGTVVVLIASLGATVGLALPAQAAAGDTVVSLTFDDANFDQLAAAQTLNANGLTGTFFIPSGFVGSADHLTQTNVAAIANLGNEIGGHSVNHPDLGTLASPDAKREICNDRVALTQWGYKVTSFAYPFAVSTPAIEALVKECGYNSARGLGDLRTVGGTCPGCAVGETMPPANAYLTRAADQVDSTWTLADLQRYVTQATANGGGWVQLTFHHICENQCDNATPSLTITPALFAEFSAWLKTWQNGASQTVKTVDAVVGGAALPTVPGPGLVLQPAPGPGVNGVQNPSLETAGTTLPQCWSSYPSGDNLSTLATVTPGHTGNVAVEATLANWVSGDAKAMQTAPACSPGVTPGATYSLRAWYKSNVAPQFAVYYLDINGGLVYWTTSSNFAASATYTQAVWTTPAVPAGVAAISFGLSFPGNGVITSDDYALYNTVGAPIVESAFTTTPVPTITGTAQVGSILTADAGTWVPAPDTVAYQWSVGGAAVAGYTTNTYTPTAADVGKTVTVAVTGTKAGYTTVTTTSLPTAAVAVVALSPTPTPTISGIAQVGATLTASPGTWGPAPVEFAYQWSVGGTAVTGATGATYVTGVADVGKTVTVAVTGTKAGYTTTTLTSAATTPLTGADLTARPTPTVSGTAQVGSVLTASAGTWGPAPVTLSYQWAVGGTAVSGATATTYSPAAADVGKSVTVAVTGTKAGYASVTNTSTASSSVIAATVPTASRLSGADRYGTSAAISAATYSPGVAVAYIASGANFPDALSGSAVAGITKGPVLLVSPDSIQPVIAAELNRLKPKKIVILGGPNAISTGVQSALAAIAPTSRLSGDDRFGTSAAISAASYTSGVDVAYVASGGDFPDALSGSAAATAKKGPVLLVSPNAIPAIIAAELSRLKPKRIVILGGPNAVNSSVESALAAIAPVSRHAGDDRFGTSAAISAASFSAGTGVVYIASGGNFPDALSGAAAAGLNGAPVLLVTGNTIPPLIAAELTRLKPSKIVILGGPDAISNSVQTQLNTFLK